VKIEVAGRGHSHARLLAGLGAGGQPVYEEVPGTMVTPGVYDVLGSPVLTYGCAAGDRIRVAEDGSFEVLRRGGNLCLVLFPASPPADDEVTLLTTAFQHLDGIVETPPDRRFVVVTVPVKAGFAAIENVVNDWTATRDCPWEYGNVYDEAGDPLGWWTAPWPAFGPPTALCQGSVANSQSLRPRKRTGHACATEVES